MKRLLPYFKGAAEMDPRERRETEFQRLIMSYGMLACMGLV